MIGWRMGGIHLYGEANTEESVFSHSFTGFNGFLGFYLNELG